MNIMDAKKIEISGNIVKKCFLQEDHEFIEVINDLDGIVSKCVNLLKDGKMPVVLIHQHIQQGTVRSKENTMTKNRLEYDRLQLLSRNLTLIHCLNQCDHVILARR